MGVLIQCSSKGCFKTQEALLDLSDNEVYCCECGNKIPGVTQFTKVSMKGLGQIKRHSDKPKEFSVRCKFCQKEISPKLINNQVHCELCNRHLDYISKPFLQLIKDRNK